MAKKERKEKEGGFTLIEFIIVIGIIGILAAIAIPSYNTYRERSYISICVSDSKNAYTAAQSYFMFECDQ
ncbi:MAG: prepilin-type N-terminal cleavage/methylation domain-containing protein [Deltaproteobacteria bacterium]|nr:prepilin-type N-terminal cleavage/methylation domain-containing protein [Deltaproteobacteria bacterium]